MNYPNGYLPTLQDLARKHGVEPPEVNMSPSIYIHSCLAVMALELGIWKPEPPK